MSGPLPRIVVVAALAVVAHAGAAQAEPPTVQITLKDHRFTPNEVHLPVGQATILEVTNADATADEFEMRQLAIEKVIVGGATARVRLRPLGPGRYQFIGEYNEATAHGTVIVDTPANAAKLP
jgi:heme/copper-type cytochrome/quinol oxidase subunit 2